MKEYWIELRRNDIKNIYKISSYGRIKIRNGEPHYPGYCSTNGFLYSEFHLKGDTLRSKLIAIDELVGELFVHVPERLVDKKIRIHHKDHDKHNNHIDNLEWVIDEEVWRDVNYPGILKNAYSISSFGRIKNNKTGHISDIHVPNCRGYFTREVTRQDGSKYKEQLHRLIAHEFVPNPANGNEVNHIDGDKTNNYWKNLEWVSHKDNMRHAYNLKMIKRERGEGNPNSKLSNDIVEKVCKLFITAWGNSQTVYEILKLEGFEISLKQIQHIKHKECWNWVSDKYWSKQDLDMLHIKKIHLICDALKETNGDVNKVLTILTDKIPLLSKRFVQLLKYKEAYTDISDKYF